MDFDPAAIDAQKAESEKPLEEISSSDIATYTLKAVCQEVASTSSEADALWEDIRHLYSIAEIIEEETLGRDTGAQVRSLRTELVNQKGEALFKAFVDDTAGGKDA